MIALKMKKKIRLSGWVAKENLNGRIPNLTEVIKDENWLEKLPPTPDDPAIRADFLLKILVTLYPKMGKTIFLNMNKISHQKNNPAPFLYALSYCSDSEEFQSLLFDFLETELECIKTESTFPGGAVDIKITPKGWKRVNNIENKTVKENSKTAFIAMWIHPSMDKLKKSIEKAVESSGYEPLRIDDKKHSNKIDDEILAEIDNARFIICDLTSSDIEKPRGSVYFEAGYAKGKKVPVIWTCSDKMREVQSHSFDTRQYKCLFWNENKMEGFIKELQDHIEDNKDIGRGPL